MDFSKLRTPLLTWLGAATASVTGRVSEVCRSPQGERGQLLILVAGTLTMIMAFAAIVVDVGFATHTKRDLQNDVDAMVLAAVREMPNEDAAWAVADEWAGRNGVADAEVTSFTPNQTCGGDSLDGTVTARLDRDQETFLARVLGINSVNLEVCATARIGAAAAGDDLLPFGFLEEDPEIADVCYFEDNDDLWNNSCILKIPKPNETWAPGNTGPIRLDEDGEPGNYDPDCSPGSSGASEYQENIEDGSECFYAIGDEIRTKPGSMRGPTCKGFDNRLDGNNDTLEEVFGEADGDGYHNNIDLASPRFGIVPIVFVPEGASGSSTNVTITGFIAVYIEGACDGGGCNGKGNNPACVVITPMKSKIVLSSVAFGGGGFSDKNPLLTIKLVD